jgi:hypothetical protein
VESLTRRIGRGIFYLYPFNKISFTCAHSSADTLERLYSGSVSPSASRGVPERSQGEEPPRSSREGPTTTSSIIGVLSTLSEEIRNLRSSIAELPKLASEQPSTPARSRSSDTYINRNGKRQRLGVNNILNATDYEAESRLEDHGTSSSDILTGKVFEKLVTAYFNHVHPWIPMIHEATFRQKLHQSRGQRPPLILLHAMVVGALRLLDAKEAALQIHCVQQEVERSRRLVILKAADSLSVENLQALIITAFTDVGQTHSSQKICSNLFSLVMASLTGHGRSWDPS